MSRRVAKAAADAEADDDDSNAMAPQVCQKAKNDWLPIEEEGIMPRFLEDYEITRGTDDFVTIKSVKKWLRFPGSLVP